MFMMGATARVPIPAAWDHHLPIHKAGVDHWNSGVLPGFQRKLQIGFGHTEEGLQQKLALLDEALDVVVAMRVIAAFGSPDLKKDDLLEKRPDLKDYIANPRLAAAHLERIIPTVFSEPQAISNPLGFVRERFQNLSVLQVYRKISWDGGLPAVGKLHGTNPENFFQLRAFFKTAANNTYLAANAMADTVAVRVAQLKIAENNWHGLTEGQYRNVVHYTNKWGVNAPKYAASELSNDYIDAYRDYCQVTWAHNLTCPYEDAWQKEKAKTLDQLNKVKFDAQVAGEVQRRSKAETEYAGQDVSTPELRFKRFVSCDVEFRHGLSLGDPVYSQRWQVRATQEALEYVRYFPEGTAIGKPAQLGLLGEYVDLRSRQPLIAEEIKGVSFRLPFMQATASLALLGEHEYVTRFLMLPQHLNGSQPR